MIENLENEVWKPIKGFEGLYEVSNLGRIKSLKFGKEKILKTDKSINKEGYHKVSLRKDKIRYFPYIHRLVAFHFIPIPKELKDIPIEDLQVNHKNENPSMNNVDNLEWCTQQYNIEYSQAKQVYQYDKELNLIQVWKSTNECGRNGFNFRNISECCNGKRNFHKGFIWSYTEIKKPLAS